jgi:hypothetical protein
VAQVRDRDEYLALAKSLLAHDEIYYLNEAGEALWVDALPLTAALLAAGQARWAKDKRHVDLLAKWLPEGPPARVVLVGLYVRKISVDDVLKKGRFRFQLREGGELVDPVAVEEVKSDVWGDYYPVFSRWDKVFAVRFPAQSSEGGSLVVLWPAGERELGLTPAPSGSKKPGKEA